MGKLAKIFLVEDDQNFGSVLKSYLEMNDFSVIWVDNGREAIREFNNNTFDLCVLDVMLPYLDGFSVAESITKLKPEVPFIFLTAKTLKEDILKGYAAGAVDYLTKPFDSEVLIWKIKAILAKIGQIHPETQEPEVFQMGHFTFNYPMRTIESKKTNRKLSPKESELLRLLNIHKNNVLPREEALKAIWGEDSYFTTRSMDVFITKLRKYLKDDPRIEIMNIHGNGFRLILPE